MNKISITLDVSKFNKGKIVDRVYTDKSGAQATRKEYKVELVRLKEPKVIKQTDTYIMKKTHFVKETQTKEERDQKLPSVYVGEGFTFEDPTPVNTVKQPPTIGNTGVEYPDDDINAEDIPF